MAPAGTAGNSISAAASKSKHVTLDRLVRAQYPEFSICNPIEWIYPFIFICLFFYTIYQLYSRVKARRAFLLATRPTQLEMDRRKAEQELTEKYAQALKEHTRICTLYLQLLDLIVVADPLNRGERYNIQQNFRAAIKTIPLELSEEELEQSNSSVSGWGKSNDVSKAVIAAQRWAHICWIKHIVGATQSIPRHLWNQRVVYGNSNDSDQELETWRKELEVKKEDNGEEEVRTTAVLLNWRCDLMDDWPFFADIVQAIGVKFTPNDIRKMSEGEDGVFEDFVPELVKQVYAAGHTLILPSGDDALFMFVRINDYSSVEKLLRALYSKSLDEYAVRFGRLYGGNRLMKEGESFHFPGKTIEEGIQEADENVRIMEAQEASWSYWIWENCGSLPLDEIAKGIALISLCLCCFGLSVRLLEWGCVKTTYTAWILAASFDCGLIPLFTAFWMLIVLLVLHVVMINPLLNQVLNSHAMKLLNHQKDWNPATVPLPNELLQL